MKNTHRWVLLLVNLQAEACNFTKSNTPPWVFFTFFKLYKWYQIAQSVTHGLASVKVTLQFWVFSPISNYQFCLKSSQRRFQTCISEITRRSPIMHILLDTNRFTVKYWERQFPYCFRVSGFRVPSRILWMLVTGIRLSLHYEKHWWLSKIVALR